MYAPSCEKAMWFSAVTADCVEVAQTEPTIIIDGGTAHRALPQPGMLGAFKGFWEKWCSSLSSLLSVPAPVLSFKPTPTHAAS